MVAGDNWYRCAIPLIHCAAAQLPPFFSASRASLQRPTSSPILNLVISIYSSAFFIRHPWLCIYSQHALHPTGRRGGKGLALFKSSLPLLRRAAPLLHAPPPPPPFPPCLLALAFLTAQRHITLNYFIGTPVPRRLNLKPFVARQHFGRTNAATRVPVVLCLETILHQSVINSIVVALHPGTAVRLARACALTMPRLRCASGENFSTGFAAGTT